MKTIKANILVLFSIFLYAFCNAQQFHLTSSQWLAEHKKAIATAPYIFEGTVTQQTSMRNAAATCFVIQITKIYRGSPQLKLGTIKIIIEENEFTVDGGPFLSKGSMYIILGTVYNSTLFESITTDNTMKLTYSDPIAFNGKGGAIWGDTKYHSTDSLYSFFKENGLTVQEEKK
jgi:hypothetical protein